MFHKIQRTWLKAVLLALCSLLFLTAAGCAVLYFWAMDYVGFVPPWTVQYSASAAIIAASLSIFFFAKFNKIKSLLKPLLTAMAVLAVLFLTLIGQNSLLDRSNKEMAQAFMDQAMAGLSGPAADEKNSYLIYQSLFDTFSEEESQFLEQTKDPGFDPLTGEAEWLLAKHPHILEKMLEASLRPEYYYPFSFEAELPSFFALKDQLDLFRFCGLAAHNLAAKGRLYEAGQILNDLRLLSNRLQEFPVKGLHYLGPYFQELIREVEEKCLFASEEKAENMTLPASPDAFSGFPNKPMEIEIAWIAHVMVSPDFRLEDASVARKLSGEMIFMDKVCSALSMEMLFVNYQLNQMEIFLENLKIVIERPCTNIEENRSQSFVANEHSYVGKMMGFGYFRSMDCKCFTQLHNSMETLIRAIWKYRIDHGQYPKSLDVLVPDYLEDIPMNPYTGQALAVEFMDGGLTINSQAQKSSMGRFPGDFHMGTAYEKYRLAEKNQAGKNN